MNQPNKQTNNHYLLAEWLAWLIAQEVTESAAYMVHYILLSPFKISFPGLGK